MSIVLFSLYNNFSAIDVKNALLCFTLGSPKGGGEGGRGPIKREGGGGKRELNFPQSKEKYDPTYFSL